MYIKSTQFNLYKDICFVINFTFYVVITFGVFAQQFRSKHVRIVITTEKVLV